MEDLFVEVLQEIAACLTRRGITLAVAESCTGGYIADTITDLPGASGFFVLGVVAYSAAAKEVVLGIPAEDILTCGTVSAETAAAMARGVCALGRANVGLATTGVAGPASVEGKEVGLVYIAAATEEHIETRTLRLSGDRSAIKREASLEALKLLREFLACT